MERVKATLHSKLPGQVHRGDTLAKAFHPSFAFYSRKEASGPGLASRGQ